MTEFFMTALPETLLDGETGEGSTVVPCNVQHPMMTTSFADYSVSEGLLLLIFLVLLLDFFLNLIRRWF